MGLVQSRGWLEEMWGKALRRPGTATIAYIGLSIVAGKLPVPANPGSGSQLIYDLGYSSTGSSTAGD